MSHLILATNDLAAYRLQSTRLASDVVGFNLRLVSGPLPTEAELATLLAPRSAAHAGDGKHWLDYFCRVACRSSKKNLGILEFCNPFDSIELWVDPDPNDQLVLLWLLDALRPYKEVISKLSLVQTDDRIASYGPESVAKWKLPAFKITERHLALAGRAWRAYRASTPEDCFALLSQDTLLLPRFRAAIITLLEELPDRLSGVGASEWNMLESVDDGCDDPMVALGGARYRGVFDDREAAELLDELAQCPVPAIIGMGEGPFDRREEARAKRYRRSKVSLTKLGRAIVAGEEDFSRYNPVKRWWGGTLLTNEQLWRWDRQARSLVAPA